MRFIFQLFLFIDDPTNQYDVFLDKETKDYLIFIVMIHKTNTNQSMIFIELGYSDKKICAICSSCYFYL